nr:LysE family translocator [Fundidesulfovibrio terrae]
MYLAALAVVYLTPGPDMALVMATAARSGARAGFFSAAGIAVARFAHVMVSGLGLAALLAAQPLLLGAVRTAGAVYLAWLAWKLWSAPADRDGPQDADASPRGAVLRGFATNLLNPKALLFCGMLLPQFASPGRGPLLPQFVWLGVLLVCMGLMFDTAYVLAASGLARRVSLPAKFGRARNMAMGSVFLALAARLAAG